MKRFFAFMLTIAIVLCCSGTVFAESDDNSNSVIPEGATKHVVALQLQPEEEYSVGVNASVGNEASPYVWGDPSITMVDNHTAYTGSFYLSDRYFAFEMEGFLEDGNTYSDEGYCVALQYVGSTANIASMTGLADGSIYKADWIDIYTDGYYRFKVINGTDYTLTVYLTYYSWN